MFERLGRFIIRFRLPPRLLARARRGLLVLAPTLSESARPTRPPSCPTRVSRRRRPRWRPKPFPVIPRRPGHSGVLARRRLTDADREYIAGLPARIISPDAPEALARGPRGVTARPPRVGGLAAQRRRRGGDRQREPVGGRVRGERRGGVQALRALLADTMPEGLVGNVTGQSGIGADYMDAALDATDRTTVVTVVLVVVILLIIYRAPLAALAPLLTIGVAWVVARGVLGGWPRPGGR